MLCPLPSHRATLSERLPRRSPRRINVAPTVAWMNCASLPTRSPLSDLASAARTAIVALVVGVGKACVAARGARGVNERAGRAVRWLRERQAEPVIPTASACLCVSDESNDRREVERSARYRVSATSARATHGAHRRLFTRVAAAAPCQRPLVARLDPRSNLSGRAAGPTLRPLRVVLRRRNCAPLRLPDGAF